MQTQENSKVASSSPQWTYSGDIGGNQFDIRRRFPRGYILVSIVPSTMPLQ